MYHVILTNDRGIRYLEDAGDVIGMVLHRPGEDGVRIVSLLDGAPLDACFETLLGIDELKQRFIADDPELRIAYLLKDELVTGEECIDITRLHEVFGDD